VLTCSVASSPWEGGSCASGSLSKRGELGEAVDDLLRLAMQEKVRRGQPRRDGVDGDAPPAQLLGQDAGRNSLTAASLKGFLSKEHPRMSLERESIAQTLVADGKGILAADETVPTLTRRFDTLGTQSTEQSRRTYREMLFTAPGAAEFISGVNPAGRDYPPAGFWRHATRSGPLEPGHPSRHQSRHWREAACRLSRRDSHRGARRAPRPPLRVPWNGRPLREVARGHPYH
jgi:hypothetical protein